MTKMSIKLAGLTTALIAPVLLASPAFAEPVFSAAQTSVFNSETSSVPSRNPRNTLDRLLLWNEIMLDANAVDHTGKMPDGATNNPLAGDQQGPTRNSRAFAIIQTSVYDAVNSFKGRFQPYNNIGRAPRGASINAAIIASAHRSLVAMYPKQTARLNSLRDIEMGRIPGSAASKAQGTAVGLAAANAMITRRATDNTPAGEQMVGAGPGQYHVNPAAGHWSPSPIGPNPGIALGVTWGAVTPFALTSGAQFRLPPPPAPGSAAFTAGFNEVKAVGAALSNPNGSASTREFRFIGDFWGYDGAPLLGTPPRLYNQVAKVIARRGEIEGVANYARYLAQINLVMADCGITAWNNKYFYDYWRPQTGVQRGGEVGAAGDTTWVAVGASRVNNNGVNFTPPFPAYPSGHSTFGSGLFQTIRQYLPNNTRFTFISDEYDGISADGNGVLRPLAPVRYRSLSEAELENGKSRVYNGVHWDWDNTGGAALGTNVANFVDATQFNRVRNWHDDNERSED
jgi:hypothetical protein